MRWRLRAVPGDGSEEEVDSLLKNLQRYQHIKAFKPDAGSDK
jgi:hypothetical protein